MPRIVAGGLDTPNTTQYATGDLIFLAGQGYELGKHYRIVRELRDPNRRELFDGQATMLKAMGQPYAELATVRVDRHPQQDGDCPDRIQLQPGDSRRHRNRLCGETGAAGPSSAAL